jgi:hypothetical protein
VNKNSLLCACAAVAAMMITAIPAMANTAPRTKTTVPFSFLASGKTMPAGDYVMAKSSENVMSVRNEKGETALAIVTQHVGAINSVSQPKLIFVRKNGQYHLKEIHLGGVAGSDQIPVK